MFAKNPPKTNSHQFSNRTLNKYKQTISLWENGLKYRMEIDNLVEWCHNNDFTLIISKAKEMIVDWGQTKDDAPVIISRMMGRESQWVQFPGSTRLWWSVLGVAYWYNHEESSTTLHSQKFGEIQHVTQFLFSMFLWTSTIIGGEHTDWLHDQKFECSRMKGVAKSG